MIVEMVNNFLYASIFLTLFAIDYVLGHGFVDMFQTVFCKIICMVKKTVREEEKLALGVVSDNPLNLGVLAAEFLVLILTAVTFQFLNKYKQYRTKDRIDELLQESKDALKQTNEFLEKWRLRRINWQVPTEYSYLDDEPQDIKPLKLEVPILHMAIIDTLGTTRSQPERGDAGDSCNITDSTLLSVTSLIDDDQESITEPLIDEKVEDNKNNIEFNNRYLWDVMEEDANSLEDD